MQMGLGGDGAAAISRKHNWEALPSKGLYGRLCKLLAAFVFCHCQAHTAALCGNEMHNA